MTKLKIRIAFVVYLVAHWWIKRHPKDEVGRAARFGLRLNRWFPDCCWAEACTMGWVTDTIDIDDFSWAMIGKECFRDRCSEACYCGKFQPAAWPQASDGEDVCVTIVVDGGIGNET